MKKIFTWFILCFMLGLQSLSAQLASGSIAPNFTGKDINGQTWTLYDLLDQGKSVVLDIGATWCGPCWSYHNTHVLENLYEQYGPNGTGEFMVFFIEGDPNTGMADLQGNTAATQGNWIAGTQYPIIDDSDIADLYEITYFPTLYLICPNRIVTELAQLETVAEYYENAGECTQAFGLNNGALLAYSGFKGSFCQEKSVAPSAKFQNLGLDTIKSATIVLTVNGAAMDTLEWTGSLAKYHIEDVVFPEMMVNADTDISISIADVNGTTDEDNNNDSVTASIKRSVIADNAALNLTLATDPYAYETYWELLDQTGNAVYTGGNQGIFSNPPQIHPDSYAGNSQHSFDLPLPKDGCYEFKVYDYYGDGMCCEFGQGGYQITNDSGTVIAAGGQFGSQISHLFEISGAEPVLDNAQIVVYTGERDDFCHSVSYAPSIAFQNIGNNPVTSADFQLSIAGEVVETYTWTGDLAPLDFTLVNFSEVTINETGEVSIALLNVNGQADEKTYKNSYAVALTRQAVTLYDTITLRLRTDTYGAETFWYISNEMGDIVASGGNPNVGPDGGGTGDPINHPDAYGANRNYTIPVVLPANGCYELSMVDAYGDGMCCQYGQGSFSLEDEEGLVLASGGQYGAYNRTGFEVNKPVATTDLNEVAEMQLFPNPVSSSLNVSFSLDKGLPLEIGIQNTLGQQISTIRNAQFASGKHQVALDVRELSNGIYFLTLRSAERRVSYRFVVHR